MQKRDKFGRFLKGKVVKKKNKFSWLNPKTKPKKKAKKVAIKKGKIHVCDDTNFVKVQKVKKGHLRPSLNELTLYDLQDMIQAEVMFQMKEIW